MNAIHYHSRSESQISQKPVYLAIGINMNGVPRYAGSMDWGK
ncbi:hypothetical protein Q5O14_12630 [Eubacteriaceae bacterium ES2]|nr:hypothetical protein Q5O14_12630 [Eubacteriaceae bacterium ES2]